MNKYVVWLESISVYVKADEFSKNQDGSLSFTVKKEVEEEYAVYNSSAKWYETPSPQEYKKRKVTKHVTTHLFASGRWVFVEKINE